MKSPGISVRLSGLQKSQDVVLGPFPVIRVAGNFMRAGPDSHVIASYARHQWHAAQQFFAAYECSGPAFLYFEDQAGTASERFGPFDLIRVADGTMYADNELFAKFIDESVLWHSMVLETWWPTLVIEAT